jgi:oxygen-independent coproporphyrinogen III oxidase
MVKKSKQFILEAEPPPCSMLKNDVSNLKECTLEANPDDLNSKYVQSLKKTPINRFSIGVQSFLDADLKYMNRTHTAQEADYAIKTSQDAGFEKLTIDLIYGTPGLNNMAWLENMMRVESLGIPHFSAYALTVEEGTALHHAIDKKKQSPVDNEQSAQQLELLMQYAPKMGFEQYEISNFASKEQYALHNTNYWKGVPYIGIGPSAHSFDGSNRRNNIANNSLYLKSILQEKKLDYEEEILTNTQRLNEYLMTSLRTMWGIDVSTVEKNWGSDILKKLLNNSKPFENKNWLEMRKDNLTLTNTGKLFADYIASSLFELEA